MTNEQKVQRLTALKAEMAEHAGKEAAAEAAVGTSRTALEAAGLNEVIEGASPATTEAAEAALEAALLSRDRLQARGKALAAGIAMLTADLNRAAQEARKAALAAAVEKAQAEVAAQKAVVESALIRAGLLWMLQGRGHLDGERLGEALQKALGLNWQGLRTEVVRSYDAAQAEATAAAQALQVPTNGR